MWLVGDGAGLLMGDFDLCGLSQYLGLVVIGLGCPTDCLTIVEAKFDWATLVQ